MTMKVSDLTKDFRKMNAKIMHTDINFLTNLQLTGRRLWGSSVVFEWLSPSFLQWTAHQPCHQLSPLRTSCWMVQKGLENTEQDS